MLHIKHLHFRLDGVPRLPTAAERIGDGWIQTTSYRNGPKKDEPPPEVVNIPSFDWDAMPGWTFGRTAAHALDQAYCLSFTSVSGVRIKQCGKPTDLP